jgi:hypothetical protein
MIGVLYEHPTWFARLFEHLRARDLPYRELPAASLQYTPAWWRDPQAMEHGLDLVVNRMSPSADRRGHARAILPTLQYLESLEAGGVRVVNGTKAYGYEISKARQMALLATLGLPYPATRVINDPARALAASEGLRFPVVVKPSVGGSGAGSGSGITAGAATLPAISRARSRTSAGLSGYRASSASYAASAFAPCCAQT